MLDLQDKIIAIQESDEYLEILTNNNIPHLSDLTSQSTALLKDWLFTYYTAIRDFISYDAVNSRSLKYKDKITRDSSIDDLALHDRF